MKLHLPKMLFAAVMACFGMVQAATLSSISEKTPITINLNFDSGRGAVPQDTTKITVAGVTTTGDQWINLTGGNGTDIAVTDTAGKTYKLTFSSSGTWAASGTADALNINKGYLDMANWAGGKGISITLTNEDGTAIAWNQVNILMTGDGGQYGGVNVNGTNYYYTGTTLTEGNAAWGARTGSATYTEGTNLMVLKPGSVASSDGLVLTTTGGGAARATMGGLQVVTGYGPEQITAYKISDFSEGETASLAALAAGADLTKVPLTIEVTATAAADDVAMLGLDAATGEVIVKGGALGMDVTTDTTVGTIAFEDGGNIGALNIAEGKTLTVTGPMAGLATTTSGTGKLVIGMVNNKEASGNGILNFGDSCEFESVRVSSGVVATNLNGAELSANIGSADLIMAGGTTYVIRNGNGANASITSGDIVLEGAMDLQVYGSTHNSVISNNIIEASEDASTYIRKTDGGTTTLTGEVTVDSVRVAAGTLVLGDGNVTTTGQIRLSENGANGNKLVIAEGATLNVTGSTNAHSTGDSIVLAHWGQTGFLEVNGGTLNAEGAVALMSWTGTGTFSILSGTAKVSGLDFWGQSYSGTEFKGTLNLGTADEGDGVLELGGTGIQNVGSAGGGTATLNLGNGTIRAMADTQITRITGFSSGVVNLIGTNGGTVFDTNGHDFSTVNLGMEGDGDLVKIGEGTLTTGRITTTGQIKIDEGTWVVDGNTTISKTIINNGTIQGGIGKIVVESLDGFEGEAEYSDKLAPGTGNGYMSSANFVVIKAEEGQTSTLSDLTTVSFGGMDLDLISTETQSSVSVKTSGDAGAYFVNEGEVVYGADDNSAYSDATTALVANGGDLTLSKELKDNIPQIQVAKDTKLTINEGVSLGKGQLSGEGAVTLAGDGMFENGAATALPTSVTIGSDWTGTVVVDGFGFAGDDGKLANLANSNSFVGLTNCTGWLTPGGTVSGNLNLLKGNALSLSDGSSGRTQTFSGKVKGEGDFLINMVGKDCSNITYVFSGDVSEWTGSFRTLAPSAKTFGLQFTGAGDINAAVTNTNGIILNMVVGGAGERTMTRAIENNGGTLNLTVNGAGHKTFKENITATMLTVASGTGVTLEGTTTVGQLAASGTITNKGAFSVTGGLNGTINTTGLEIVADKSTLVKADGVTASDDGNGFMTGGFYYVVHSTDGGTLAIDAPLVTGSYKLDGNDLLYTAAGNDTTYYINNSIAFTGSDAANVAAGKTIQVMSGAVLSLESTGVDAAVTLATKGTGTVLLVGSGDWNCENSLGADKKQIGNLQTDSGVNAVVSFATMDAFKNSGTNITLADDSLLKVSVAAGQTKGMASFNNVKGGTIVIDPNSGSGNLVLDGTTTYNGNVEFLLKQYIIVDGALFTAVDGKYADVNIVQSASGKAFTLTNREVGKANALHIGCLSGDGTISGAYGNNNAKRYIAIHQDKDTTYSGVNAFSSGDRGVGFLKYGEGTLTLTGANTSTSELEIHEGTVVLDGAGKWAGDVMIASGAKLDMSGADAKSLTKLTVAGGATLAAGGDSIALGSLVLEGVGAGKLLTLEGVDQTQKSTVLFTGLTGETAISGITFETELGQQVAAANKYIAGASEEARLLFSNGTLSLVSKLSADFYWHGTNTTWDDTDVDWSNDEEVSTPNVAYIDAVNAHFVGVSGTITLAGERGAAGLFVTDGSELVLDATGDGSLVVNGDLTVEKSELTLKGDITISGDVNMGDASGLTVATTEALKVDGVEISGSAISHTGDTEKLAADSANFTVTGGSVTAGDADIKMTLSGVTLAHTGAGTLSLSADNTVASLTTAGTVLIDGTTTIGGTAVSGGASVKTGGTAFDLTAATTEVTDGAITTDATNIGATLSGVTLTTTADTTLSGALTNVALITGSTTATVAGTINLGGDEINGSKISTGTSAYSLASATTTVTGGSVTTGASAISAGLTGVELTTTADTTISGTLGLTSLAAGGTVTIDGSVDTASVTGPVTLGGTGSLTTAGDLTLAGASSIGSLTAQSLAFGDGATLKAADLSLTNTSVAVGSLTGISSTNHLLDVTGGINQTDLVLGITLDNLKQATFDASNKLVLGEIAGLNSATFAEGATTLSDAVSKHEYTISTEGGVITVSYTSSGNGWIGGGTWDSGEMGEFVDNVTPTSDAAFLGEGSADVNVKGNKTVGEVIVDVQPETTVDSYTFTGDAITTGELLVSNGGLTVGNAITADTTEVGATGELTIDSEGSITTGVATGTITNNGTLTMGDGSEVTLSGEGALATSGNTTVAMGDGAKIATLTTAADATVALTTDAAIGVLENEGAIEATGKTITLSGASTAGGKLTAGSLVVAEGASASFTELTADTATATGSLTATTAALETGLTIEEGATATFTALDAGTVTNNGTLEVGAGTSIGTLTGGSLVVTGAATVNEVTGLLDSLSGNGSLMVQENTPLQLSGTTEGAVSLNVAALDVTPSSTTSFVLGNLEADEIIFGKDNLASATDALLSLTGVASASSYGLDVVTFTQADVAQNLLESGEYDLLTQTEAIDLAGFTLDGATQMAYINKGLSAVLAADGNTLRLVIALDDERTWNTISDEIEVGGVPVHIPLSGQGVYSSLDMVHNVNVNGDNTVDLTGEDLSAATDPSLGLTVRNLTGEAGKTLTLKGSGADADLVTLMNNKNTSGAESLDLDGLTAQVMSENGSSLTIGDLEMTGAKLDVQEGATFTVAALNGDGNSTIKGTVGVTGNGTYSGAYDNATILMKGGRQTLKAASGLTVAGTAGTAVLMGNTVGKIATTGASVELGDGSTTSSLTLGGASSMNGGTLTIWVQNDAFANGIGSKETAPVITTGASLNLSGVTLKINQALAGSQGAISLANTTQDKNIVILVLNDDDDSLATNCTVDVSGMPLLDKYFTNVRLVQGCIAVVGDRRTNYYGEKFTALSANGRTGATMAGQVLSYMDPQNNRIATPDLAMVLDAMDNCVNTGDQATMDNISSAFAGASLAALDVALHNDLDRQLRAIRNRVATMGSPEECIVLDDQPRCHAWINGEGAYNRLKQDGTAAGYTLNSWGGTVGFDYDFSTRFTAGVALTAMYGDLNSLSANSTTDGDLDSFYLSLFARYASGAWVHSFVVTMGRSDFSLRRMVNLGTGSYSASSQTAGHSFGGMYELGYTIPIGDEGKACWQPTFNIAFKHSSVDSFTESGTDAALQVGDQNMTSVTVGLGARTQMVVGETLANRSSVLELRGFAKAEFGDRTASSDVSLVRLRRFTGSVESAKQDVFGLEFGAGLIVPVGVETGNLFLDVSGEWRGKSSNFNAVFGYRMSF